MTEDSDIVMGGKAKGVEPGVYLAEFAGHEKVETQKGEAYKWLWRITGPKNVGQFASCLTDRTNPRPTNKFGKVLNGLAMKTLGEGDRFNPKSVVGQRYTIVVTGGSEGGGTRVTEIFPPTG